jgi:hypothetical protein
VTVALKRFSFKGCYLAGAIVLVLSVFSSALVYEVTALEVRNHTMAIGISPQGMPLYDNIYLKGGWYKAEFSTEDERAYVWMNVTLDKRMTITAQWHFPNGSMYQTNETIYGEGLRYVWFFINIRNYPPAHALGMWEVKILADDTSLFNEKFAISQAPTFPWTTILEIVGLLVTAISAPLSLAFLRMKKPPPKLSFALSLVGGIMIAVSGFFRGALGGEMFIYSTAAAMGILYGVAITLFLGIAISVSVLTRRRIVILALSAISLLYAMLFFNSFMQGTDIRLYFLPLALTITGIICSILGGLLIKRET